MSHINLLHIGINNLDDQQPKDISLDLKELAESFHNKFICGVFVSGVAQRGYHYQNHVYEGNNRQKHQLSSSTVKLITHKNLNLSHLHDDRHLQQNKNQGESTSGVQQLAKNLFEVLTKIHYTQGDLIKSYVIHQRPSSETINLLHIKIKWINKFVLSDLLNSQYSNHSNHIVHSTQTTLRQHTKILMIIAQIIQTVRNKNPLTDIQIVILKNQSLTEGLPFLAYTTSLFQLSYKSIDVLLKLLFCAWHWLSYLTIQLLLVQKSMHLNWCKRLVFIIWILEFFIEVENCYYISLNFGKSFEILENDIKWIT